ESGVGTIFVKAFPKLAPELQQAAFGQVIKRSDWALAMVDALKSGDITLQAIGPANVFRLRTHSDRTVAQKAGAVIDELRGTEVKTSDIKSRRSTGRSLMPEGFEALGDEALRDLFAFMGAGENRFRIIDLKPAFTANSTLGLFNNRDLTDESIRFRKYGLIKAGDIPFEIVNPA